MAFENIQNFLKKNSHGMLFGLIAAILVFIIRDIKDEQVIFWILLISIFLGAIITDKLNVPRKFLSNQAVLIIAGLIAGISFFGAQTELFAGVPIKLGAKSILGKLSKFLFGKLVGVGVLSSFVMMFNVFLGIIVLAIGLVVLGIPVGNLIDKITDNFMLIVIIGSILIFMAIIFRKK